MLHRHTALKCVMCDAKLDASEEMHGNPAQPQDGDLTLCLHCGVLMAYEIKRRRGKTVARLRPATEKDLAEMPYEQARDIATAQRRILAANATLN